MVGGVWVREISPQIGELAVELVLELNRRGHLVEKRAGEWVCLGCEKGMGIGELLEHVNSKCPLAIIVKGWGGDADT
jgi:hypothetical protein